MKNWAPFYILTLFIGVSALTFFGPIWNTDDFYQLLDIFHGYRSGLELGRPGHVFFFHGLWKGFNFLEFDHFVYVLRIVNYLFACGFLLLTYWLLLHITARPLLSFLTIFLLMIRPNFTEVANGTGSDAHMYFLISLSFALFAIAHFHQQRSLVWLIVSAICFGLSANVRVSTVFFVGFFPIYVLLMKPKRFSIGQYAIALLALAFVSFAGPIYFLLKDGAVYLQDIRGQVGAISSDPPLAFADKLKRVFHLHGLYSGLWLLPAILGASLILAWPNRFGLNLKKMLLLFLVAILPAIATFVIHTPYALNEGRFFILSLMTMDFLVAASIYAAFTFFSRGKYLAWTAGAVILLVMVFGNYLGQVLQRSIWNSELQIIENNKRRVVPHLNAETVLLAGIDGYAVGFVNEVQGLRAQVITPGFNWQGERIIEIIREELDKNRVVIFDSQSGWSESQIEDFKKPKCEFDFVSMQDGLFRILPKKDRALPTQDPNCI